MLNRRSPALQYPVQRTMQLLAWLAWQMKQHNQSTFYIEGLQSDWLPGNRSRLVYHVSTGLIFCLIVGLVGGLFLGFLVGLFFGLASGLIAGLIGGAIFGFLVGPVGGLIIGLRGGPDSSIQPTEGIVWSYERFRKRLLSALGGGLIAGLSSRTLSVDKRNTPNQGIRRSAQYAIFIGASFGMIFFWVTFGVIFGVIFGVDVGMIAGLVAGLSAALSAALIFGGEACTKHFILRLLLWHARMIPWNYSRFLDYTAERILLRKVGGGYIFIHRLLLEHFATLYEA